MNEKIWREVIKNQPGPKSIKEAMLLGAKGLAMGAADIVPGVSGGTIAFITGIYEKLINAIKSFDVLFIKRIFSFHFKDAFSGIHLRFLAPLFVGISISIIGLSGLMNYLLNHHQLYTWSVFFGLILASIILIGRKIKNTTGLGGVGFFAGLILGYFLVGIIPVQTSNSWWFIVFSGMIAISAMILPGISGSFILLILGKYEYMTGALKNPFAGGNLAVILLFILGCALGIILFSRVLSWLFRKYHNFTLAFLTGIITGSLRKIWPWKEVLEKKIVGNHEIIISEKNILPQMNGEFFIAFLLIVLAFVLITALGKKETRAKPRIING